MTIFGHNNGTFCNNNVVENHSHMTTDNDP